MRSVVFSTPGLIPIDSFTTFGINAKPRSDNPFGYFGTGLKYAIAVLLRERCEVVVWIGNDKYTFYLSDKDFRGKSFQMVRMKLQKWLPHRLIHGKASYHNLPFSTELGKNWELWQAFRELETNTRDEGGQSEIVTSLEDFFHEYPYPADNEVSFIIITGQKFLDVYLDKDRHFLPDGLTERSSKEGVQVLDRPSRSIYYRSVRIMDLKEESAYTYNFLKRVDLTEDRTAAYPFLIEAEICDLIKSSDDKAFVEKTVPTRIYSGRTYYEHSLRYPSYSAASPSSTFLEVAKDAKNSAVKEIYDASQPVVPTKTLLKVTIPKAGLTDEELAQLFGAIRKVQPSAVLEDSNFRIWGKDETPPTEDEEETNDDEDEETPRY